MGDDILRRLRNAPWTTADDCNAAASEIERLRKEVRSLKTQLLVSHNSHMDCDRQCKELVEERDEAMVLVETIAHDVDVLSTRPATIIKLSDLVYHINEWGDAARSILSKKDNTNV